MNEKKGLIELIKEKIFRSKKNKNRIEAHPVVQYEKATPEKTEKSLKEVSSIQEALRLAAMDKKTDELINASVHSSEEIHDTALNEAKKINSLKKLDLNETEKQLESITSDSSELKELAVKVKTHLIITDFDRINSLVKEKQKISLIAVAKQLNLTQKRIAECAHILEKTGLIEINYPAIGAPVLMIKNFNENQKELIKKKKEEKEEEKELKKQKAMNQKQEKESAKKQLQELKKQKNKKTVQKQKSDLFG
ncbi:MAG: hypothetical protein JW703_04060 [Candidatus Diapherotrites archaeon]|nr:hypothetical protein [Candidatus Diapherotrites archaeon]